MAACLLLLSSTAVTANPSYTEEREPCRERSPHMRPFFGDLHVHTRYSLDASTQGTRTTPDQAYGFARGKRIGIQPWNEQDNAQRSLQLRRPLDFAMVSDHAEMIGEVYMCNTPGAQGYTSWQCVLYRRWPRAAYYLFNYFASMKAAHMGLCGEHDMLCKTAALAPWQAMRSAAQQHYDRSADCTFTTFVGYEWTGLQAQSGGNLHRNVVFRNDNVPALPHSYIDGPSAQALWRALDAQCIETDSSCDALVIPHNSNISAGYMFSGARDDGSSMNREYASLRRRFEPLVEVMQHKGSSECYYKAGVTADELCAFEQLPIDNIAGFAAPPRPDTGFLRRALAQGMLAQQRLGVNPYEFGVIASTDTHLGAPGAAEEDRFLGHGGAGVPARKSVPPGLPDKLEYNPGGLAVVWAQENSRDALFQAMRRREVYGTSGPRITSRFFGGWDYTADLCSDPQRVPRAYASGVPMGGQLSAPRGGGKPTFLVAASQDAGTAAAAGTPLQRLQIVKGWVDAGGALRHQVFDVAGDAQSRATVDRHSCQRRGAGFAQLCTVWTDHGFRPEQHAYYYSRVLENPTCRWSQRICNARGVDCNRPESIGKGLEGCCALQHRPVIQERAWSSPIWYKPPA